MPNLYYASIYKNNVLDILLKNKDFIKLINPHEPSHKGILQKEVLLGGTFFIDGKKYEEQGYVFDHDFVDDTISDEKTFVFVEIPEINIIEYGMLADFYLYVCIFTSKSLVKITDDTTPSINDMEGMGYHVGFYGNRIDILCDIVDRTLNGNEKIKGVGDIKPADRGFCSLYSPNKNFYGKCLKYHIKNLNEIEDTCGN